MITFLFNRKLDYLQNDLGKYFNQKVLISKVNYSFPLRVSLNDVSIYSGRSPDALKLVVIKEVQLKISPFNSLRNKKLVLSTANILEPVFYWPRCLDFVNTRGQEIIEFIKSLPLDQDINFFIKSGKLNLSPQSLDPAMIGVESSFRKKGSSFISKGNFYLKGGSKPKKLKNLQNKDNPEYYFEGYLQKNSFKIKSAVLKSSSSKLELWGAYSGDLLSLNGYSEFRNFFSYQTSQPEIKGIIKKIKMLFAQSKDIPELKQSSGIKKIFDIECEVKMAPPIVFIKKIDFSLDGVSFNFKGDLTFLDKLLMNMSLSSYSQTQKKTNGQDGQRLEAILKGEIDDYSFSGDIGLSYAGGDYRDLFNQQYHFKVSQLKAGLTGDELISLNLSKLDIYCFLADKKHYFSLSDAYIFIDLKSQRLKEADFNASIGAGFISGKASLDCGFRPMRYGLDFLIIDAEPQDFSSLVPFFSKVKGDLRIRADLRSFPKKKLEGQLLVDNGQLEGIEFFTWLSSFFKIPQLAAVSFNSIDADFYASDEISQLNNIELNSEDVNLSGYYRIMENELINGHFLIKLSRSLLEDSPRFNSLLKLLGKDFTYLDFEFKLSGLYNEINFQWQDSKFKKGLQDSIPGFFERGLEKRVERLIEQLRTSGER
ncbi:MAG: hypothetical protein JW867_05835 [Candidatus Omnitrophica bacterium]|nr:hypothetical protein [Candidatus Omnitrophota bacterium]